MDEFKQMVDSIYGWEVKDGKAVPPGQPLPDYVLERVSMVLSEADNGLTFTGCLKFIFAEENESENREEWERFAINDWVPITQEFRDWCRTPLYRMKQMRVAIELIYGPLGKGDEDDD